LQLQAAHRRSEPMNPTDDRIVALFLNDYYRIWETYFPGLNKRAHWHAIFAARSAAAPGVSCRSLHRTLYGAYGTDIRTCIERIKDCEEAGFIRIVDVDGRSCQLSPNCLIQATEKLQQNFAHHCNDTVHELGSVFGDDERLQGDGLRCSDAVVAGIFDLLGAYDRKWREGSETVVRQKGLTPAHVNDAMDHLVTYQYWAIVMLLWRARVFGENEPVAAAMVVDEINSRMWDVLHLGHLAIKERVANLIRWGFFAERTIRKHKAVYLTEIANAAISKSLAETKPLLRGLYEKLVAESAGLAAPAEA
jgi:hypothetical protein